MKKKFLYFLILPIVGFLVLVFLHLEYVLPRKEVIRFYQEGALTEYFKELLPSMLIKSIDPKDLEFIATTHNGLANKQYIFVYPDKESKDIINIDYIEVEMDLLWPPYFWETTIYYNTKEHINLEELSPEEAQKVFFEKYRKKRIPIAEEEALVFKYPNKAGKDYAEATFISPKALIGNDSYYSANNNLKYFTSNSYFGLWRQNESERIDFNQYLDVNRDFKWVNNIQGNNIIFGSNNPGTYEGELYVYDLQTFQRILKVEFREDLFGDVFLDESGEKLIFDIGKFNQEGKVEFQGVLKVFSVNDGTELKTIEIPKGNKDIKLKENALFLEYYDENGNITDTLEVKL